MVIKKSQLYIGMLISILLFQFAIVNSVGGNIGKVVNYFDDLVALYCAIYILFFLIRKGQFRKIEKNILLLGTMLLLLGTVSSITYRIQPLIPTIVDAFTCVKFMVVFCGFSLIVRQRKLDYNLCNINFLIQLIVVAIFILLLINIFVIKIYEPIGDRHILFIEAQKLFFRHPAELADAMFFCLVILLYNSMKKNNDIYMLMATFIIITSLRIKEIAMVIILWLMYLYFIKMKLKSKVVFGIAGILSVVLFGYDQFLYYYGNHETARALLTSVSIFIANERFPLGAGFATFASAMSNEYYSPLYYTYGLNNVWGLGGGNYYAFITDTFWPVILAQFGWLGFVIILLIFMYLIKECFKIKNDKYRFICSLAIVFFLIISSLGTSSLFNPWSVLCAMCLSIFLCNSFESKRE